MGLLCYYIAGYFRNIYVSYDLYEFLKYKSDEWVVACLSGSALVSINVVTPRWVRLILGWVTVYG